MRTILPWGALLIATLTVLAGCEEDATSEGDFETLFSDDFNRPDGVLGTAWTTDIPVGSSLQIVTQRAQADASNGSPTAFYPDPLAKGTDQRISVEVIVDGGPVDNAGSPLFLISRSTDSDRGFVSGSGYGCGLDQNSLQIVFINADTINPLAGGTETIPTADGDSFRLVFTLLNHDLVCEAVTGQTMLDSISATDKSLVEGYTGFIGGDSNTFFHWDEFLLETR